MIPCYFLVQWCRCFGFGFKDRDRHNPKKSNVHEIKSLTFKTEVCSGNLLKRFALFIGDKWIRPYIMENHLFCNSVVVKNRLWIVWWSTNYRPSILEGCSSRVYIYRLFVKQRAFIMVISVKLHNQLPIWNNERSTAQYIPMGDPAANHCTFCHCRENFYHTTKAMAFKQ